MGSLMNLESNANSSSRPVDPWRAQGNKSSEPLPAPGALNSESYRAPDPLRETIRPSPIVRNPDIEMGRRPVAPAAAIPAEPSKWPAKRVIHWTVSLVGGLAVGIGAGVAVGIEFGKNSTDSIDNPVNVFDWKGFGITAAIVSPAVSVFVGAIINCFSEKPKLTPEEYRRAQASDRASADAWALFRSQIPAIQLNYANNRRNGY